MDRIITRPKTPVAASLMRPGVRPTGALEINRNNPIVTSKKLRFAAVYTGGNFRVYNDSANPDPTTVVAGTINTSLGLQTQDSSLSYAVPAWVNNNFRQLSVVTRFAWRDQGLGMADRWGPFSFAQDDTSGLGLVRVQCTQDDTFGWVMVGDETTGSNILIPDFVLDKEFHTYCCVYDGYVGAATDRMWIYDEKGVRYEDNTKSSDPEGPGNVAVMDVFRVGQFATHNNQTEYGNGVIDYLYLFESVLTLSDYISLRDDPYQIWMPRVYSVAKADQYPLFFGTNF